ncbi:MAG: hypothetical protein V3S37_07480 [Dehalococcoidia bacterium]
MLTYPFLVLTVVTLGRGWYLATRHPSRTLWQRRATVILVGSTLLAVVLWGLRFAGLLGKSPL